MIAELIGLHDWV